MSSSRVKFNFTFTYTFTFTSALYCIEGSEEALHSTDISPSDLIYGDPRTEGEEKSPPAVNLSCSNC